MSAARAYDGLGAGRHVGRRAELADGQAAEKMVHRGVADDHAVDHVLARCVRLLAELVDELADRSHRFGLQHPPLHRPAVGVCDATQDVLAMRDLRVHHSPARQRAAG